MVPPPMHFTALLIAALLALPQLAFAQAGGASPFVGSAPLASAWRWSGTGPVLGGAIASVAIHPENPEILVVANQQGRVWLSLTGGTTWVPILDRTRAGLGEISSDEDVLRELEAFIEDVTPTANDEELDEDDPDYVPDDDPTVGLDEDTSDLQEAIDTVAADARTDLQSQPEFFGLPADAAARSSGLPSHLVTPGPKVAFFEGGLLAVYRGDGLWISPDLGGIWKHVLAEPVTALAFGSELGLWVAGTPDGARFAVDPTLWIDPEDGTEGLHFFDLSADADGFYAATLDGLWAASDGQSWRRVGPLREAVLATATAPNAPGEVWATTRRGVYRFGSGGEEVLQSPGAPLQDPRSIAIFGDGRAMVATQEGPWETTSAGARWTPLTAGLMLPEAVSVAQSGPLVLVATEEGLFRLVPADQPTALELLANLPPWVPLEVLYGAAQDRVEFGMPARTNRRVLMSALPQARTYVRYTDRSRDYWSASTGETRNDWNRDFFVSGELVWVPAGRKRTDAIAVVVTDSDVFVDDGADQTMLASRVNRNLQRYQQDLGREIADLYGARAQLMMRRPLVRQLSVREQVLHDLQIAELEAILDALTGGAVSSFAIPG